MQHVFDKLKKRELLKVALNLIYAACIPWPVVTTNSVLELQLPLATEIVIVLKFICMLPCRVIPFI